MGLTLAIDFGSTFTKITAFDLENEILVGTAISPTTVDADIMIGLEKALAELQKAVKPEHFTIDRIFSCSSAAGGLRMVVAGLVGELTTKAAREAALGAGAKIVGTYSFGISDDDCRRIELLAPDLVLLTGGTDGGNKQIILHNAAMLAASCLNVPIIIAGNKMAARDALALLEKAGKYAIIAENVLPELSRMQIEPVRTAIREIFIKRITRAKGLEKAQAFVGNTIIPTPLAILKGAALLAAGLESEKGLGELIVVDVGGATTDVSSIAHGYLASSNTLAKGLTEPYEKRTVEGDLGIRYNARSLLDAVGYDMVREKMQYVREEVPDQRKVEAAVEHLAKRINTVPQSEDDYLIDLGLASVAVDLATRRHAGTIEEQYFPSGKVRMQYGKDLTGVKCVIGTGGIFAYGLKPRCILRSACFDRRYPESLRPVEPELFVDKSYILYAAGLLAEVSPSSVLRIVKKHLRRV